MIRTAGVAPQPEKREPYRVAAPLELQVGESLMSVFPHDRLKVSCTSADKQGRFTQFFSAEVSAETWERELAHARTFCFYDEIEFLIKNGLIRGGSLENAVVIRDDAVLTTEDLVKGNNCFFAVTGITDGEVLKGVHYDSRGATTQSLVMRSKSGTVRLIQARHRLDKLQEYASVEYT